MLLPLLDIPRLRLRVHDEVVAIIAAHIDLILGCEEDVTVISRLDIATLDLREVVVSFGVFDARAALRDDGELVDGEAEGDFGLVFFNIVSIGEEGVELCAAGSVLVW
jgi:hypothetical protein